jgi:hypothetical protein
VQLDAANSTLVTAVPMAGGTSTGAASFNTDAPVATFGKPDPFETDLSGGALTAGYPIDVPAGPGGLKPPLTLAYSSAAVNDQHSPQGSPGWVGEGWNLSLGAISWAEHDVNSYCYTWTNQTGCSSLWEGSWQMSDTYGTSATLIPPNINVSTFTDDTGQAITASPITWHTSPETHARIFSFQSPNPPAGVSPAPPCFRAFLPNGMMEEFGCTPDSLQWYPEPSGANQGKAYIANWLLDLITDAKGNQVHVTYQRDMETAAGMTYPRDAVPATVEWDSPGCLNAQTACTGSSWNPLMRVNFVASHAPFRGGCAANGSARCDNPVDLSGSGGLAAPEVQSTFVLNDVQVQVKAGTWNTLKDYQLSYDQSGPTTMTDPLTAKSESTAGKLVPTQLRVVGDDSTTALPSTSFTYTKQIEYYEDSYTLPKSTAGCPSWDNGNTPKMNVGCILWGQSYENNSYYLDTVSNGLGLQQQFSWKNARSKFHGANSGAAADIRNPFYCNDASVQSVYPCNLTDDNSWSRIVLTSKTNTVLRTSQAGQGGSPSSTPVPSTTSYSYQVPYPYRAWMCGDCMAGLYWGNQNDFDVLDYYNGILWGSPRSE